MENTNNEPNVGTTDVVNTNITETKPNPVTTTKEKYFDADYVSELRAESKARRLAIKERDQHLKTLLGIDPEEDIQDFTKAINNFRETQTRKEQEILAKANKRLIDAELKTKGEEYDLKLLDKLLDRNKITVEDDGIKGLNEQLEELVKEFPAIKKTKSTGEAINPPPQNKPKEDRLAELRKRMGL